MLQVTVHNRGRVPIKAFPTNAAGPATLDTRTGAAVVATVNSGDGAAEADPADPYRFFVKPVGVDLAIGDPPRVTLFDVVGDADLSQGVSNLSDQVELTHLPPDTPPPATALGLAAEPEEPQPA